MLMVNVSANKDMENINKNVLFVHKDFLKSMDFVWYVL